MVRYSLFYTIMMWSHGLHRRSGKGNTMSKITAFTLSTLRNEEILGMSLEIAEKLKNVKSVADSAQGKAFLDAIPNLCIRTRSGKDADLQRPSSG